MRSQTATQPTSDDDILNQQKAEVRQEIDEAKVYFKKILAEDLKEENNTYRFGPLPLKKSTQVLDKIIKTLLHHPEGINFKYDEKETIQAILSSEKVSIDVTRYLQDKPNFEHIAFSTKDFEAYLRYLGITETDTLITAKNTGEDVTTSLTKLKSTEIKGADEDPTLVLHMAEKVALHIYSSDEKYSLYNNFFRMQFNKEPISASTMRKLKEIILTSAIATTAAKKLAHTTMNDVSNYGFRVDYNLPSPLIEERKKLFQSHQFFYEPGFLSVSDFESAEENYFIPNSILTGKSLPKRVYSLIVGEGRLIESFSAFPKEREKLFGLGSTFAPLIFKETPQAYFFVYRCVTALEPVLMQEEKRDVVQSSVSSKIKPSYPTTAPLPSSPRTVSPTTSTPKIATLPSASSPKKVTSPSARPPSIRFFAGANGTMYPINLKNKKTTPKP